MADDNKMNRGLAVDLVEIYQLLAGHASAVGDEDATDIYEKTASHLESILYAPSG